MKKFLIFNLFTILGSMLGFVVALFANFVDIFLSGRSLWPIFPNGGENFTWIVFPFIGFLIGVVIALFFNIFKTLQENKDIQDKKQTYINICLGVIMGIVFSILVYFLESFILSQDILRSVLLIIFMYNDFVIELFLIVFPVNIYLLVYLFFTKRKDGYIASNN